MGLGWIVLSIGIALIPIAIVLEAKKKITATTFKVILILSIALSIIAMVSFFSSIDGSSPSSSSSKGRKCVWCEKRTATNGN